MPLPSSKQTLADWILRRLGAPVVNVEVTDIQLEDMIDEAVQFFHEYHYDGANRAYRAIKITDEMITGNIGPAKALTGEYYFPKNALKYRKGDVVMNPNALIPDNDGNLVSADRLLWIKTDSEVQAVFRTYYISEDSEGDYFVFTRDSDARDPKFIYDSELIGHVDSEGPYVRYDSDLHNEYRYVLDSDGDWVDSEGIWVAWDSEKHWGSEWDSEKHDRVDSDLRLDSDAYFWADSEGVMVEWDSDKHSEFFFESDMSVDGIYIDDSEGNKIAYVPALHDNDQEWQTDVAGLYVDSDGTYVLWDSDKHENNYQWSLDSEGSYVDSDGEYVLYDSDKHNTVNYLIDSELGYFMMDSEGNFVPYDNTTAVYRFTPDSDRLDSEDGINEMGNRWVRIPAGTRPHESDMAAIWLDNRYYVRYDSDKYSTLFYDSDSLGNRIEWKIRENELFFGELLVDLFATSTQSKDRFTRATTPSVRYNFVNVPTNVQRFKRTTITQPRMRRYRLDFDRFSRESWIMGTRYSYVDSDLIRKPNYTFEEMWSLLDSEMESSKVGSGDWDHSIGDWEDKDRPQVDYGVPGQLGIPVPDDIIGINKVFRIDNFSGMGMWNYEYQYFLNNFDMFYGNGGGAGGAMTNYYITKQYMELIDHMMNVQPAIRFNKHRNLLYIDTNWTRIKNQAKGSDFYLMAEVYEVADPERFGQVYGDKWLKRYATALVKMQWGSNLKKYQNTELPGGIMLSGQELYDEGKEEAEKLEEELVNSQLELDFIIG